MTELFLTVASLAAFVLALVGLAKDRLRAAERPLRGWATILLALALGVGLGALLASGGIRELRALPDYPPAVSGALLGLLAGLLASGGRSVVYGVQRDGATVRAQAAAQYAPPCPAPEAAPATPTPDDGWQESSLSEMTGYDLPPVPGLDDDPPLAPQRPGGTP